MFNAGQDSFKQRLRGIWRSFAAWLSLVIVAYFVVASVCAWILYFFGLSVLYNKYDILIMLFWRFTAVAAWATVVLIKVSLPHPVAKLARVGAFVLAFVVPAFWITWADRLPVHHVLKHNEGFVIINSTGGVIGDNRDHRARPLSSLGKRRLIQAPKPDRTADCAIMFYLNGRNSGTIMQFFQFGMHLDSEYGCDYYSSEGIIGDTPSGEYVYVPAKFRDWVNSSLVQ